MRVMTIEQKASAYDELQEQHARIMTETCEGSAKTGELHCTCVPGLERVIAEYRGKFAALRKLIQEAYEADFVCHGGSSSHSEAGVILESFFVDDDFGKAEAEVLAAASAIRADDVRNFELSLGEPKCSCDPSVGMEPCMSCAMHTAKRRLRNVFDAAQRINERSTTR